MRARTFCSARSMASSRGVALQFHAGGFARGGDFLLGVRLDLGDFGGGMARQPLGLRLRFLLRLRRGARRSRSPGWPGGDPLRRRALRACRRASCASTMSLRICCERAAKNGPAFLPIRYPSPPASTTKLAHFHISSLPCSPSAGGSEACSSGVSFALAGSCAHSRRARARRQRRATRSGRRASCGAPPQDGFRDLVGEHFAVAAEEAWRPRRPRRDRPWRL